MRSDREHAEAVALMKWVRMSMGRYPDLNMLWHVPNGGARGKAAAGKLKAEGVRTGVSDYVLDVARGGYFGLRIELKARYANGKRGYATPDQKQYIADARAQGYRAEVVVGWQAAMELLIEYLEQPRTEAAA